MDKNVMDPSRDRMQHLANMLYLYGNGYINFFQTMFGDWAKLENGHPNRSPDPIVLELFLWCYLKEKVYTTVPPSPAVLFIVLIHNCYLQVWHPTNANKSEWKTEEIVNKVETWSRFSDMIRSNARLGDKSFPFQQYFFPYILLYEIEMCLCVFVFVSSEAIFMCESLFKCHFKSHLFMVEKFNRDTMV